MNKNLTYGKTFYIAPVLSPGRITILGTPEYTKDFFLVVRIVEYTPSTTQRLPLALYSEITRGIVKELEVVPVIKPRSSESVTN